MNQPMPPRWRGSVFFDLIAAIYQDQASKASQFSERYPLATSLIMDLELAPLYGGIAALDAADEVDVQQHWLALQAKWHAEAEIQKRNMPK